MWQNRLKLKYVSRECNVQKIRIRQENNAQDKCQ